MTRGAWRPVRSLDHPEGSGAFDLGEWDRTEVVHGEEPSLLEATEEAWPRAFGAGQRARDKGPAGACGLGDEDDFGGKDPVSGRESK